MNKKKSLILLTISIILILISIFNITYAFFTEEKTVEISFESKNTFGEGVILNTNQSIINSVLPGASKNQTDKVTLSITAKSELETYYTSLIGQVDPNNTTFTSGLPIVYEVFHKQNESLDTSSLTCTEQTYTVNGQSDTCVVGTLENKLSGTPFIMINNQSINAGTTHYYDVYLWIDGNNSDNEVADKKIKISFFFMTTSNITETQLIDESDISTDPS